MSDGRSDEGTDEPAVEERTVDEQTVDGTSESGQSTGGQSAGGQSTGGQSTGSQSAGGQSAGGQLAGEQQQSSTGQTGGQSSGQTGGQSSGQRSGQTGGQSAGQTNGQSSGQTGSQSPGQRSGQTVGRGTSAGASRQPSDSMTGPAAGGTDLEPNVAAAIAYVFAPLTGVLMLLVEGDEDDFVRFHSIQSIGYGAVVIGAYVAVGIVMGVLTAIPVVGDIFVLLTLPLNGIIGLMAFAGWALLVFKAYQGERYGLPVLGPIAASN